MFNETYLKEIGIRLRKLREREKLTQPKLFSKLEQIRFGVDISKDDKINDKGRGKQFISNLENGNYEPGLSIDYALAYCKLFNVSLDYIYFGTESYKPSYDEIKELTGFTDDALNMLEKLKIDDKKFIFVLNKFLSSNLSDSFVNLIHSYFEYYNLYRKKQEMNKAYINYIESKGVIINDPDEVTFDFYPEERDYITLFKISNQSNDLAEKLKKCGDK